MLCRMSPDSPHIRTGPAGYPLLECTSKVRSSVLGEGSVIYERSLAKSRYTPNPKPAEEDHGRTNPISECGIGK